MGKDSEITLTVKRAFRVKRIKAGCMGCKKQV
jgi:hypothetical protein